MQNDIDENVIILTDEMVSKLNKESGELYIIDFWAPWCGPCNAMAPMFKKFSMMEDFSGKIKFAKINIDENTDTASFYQVTSIPTFLIVKFDKEGGKSVEIDRIMGVQNDPLSFKTKILGAIAKSQSQ